MVGAELIEFVLAGGVAFAQAEQAVGERLAARHWARTNGGQWLDRRLLAKMDRHGRPRFRLAGKLSPGLFSAPPHFLRTDLAMKNAERRGSLRSSGMEHVGSAVLQCSKAGI